MDYSRIFSGKKKDENKAEKFSACLFAAKTKQFYGKGRKLSKANIENVDIDSICDDINDIVPADNNEILYMPYNSTLGALKILEKQLDFFEEECQDTLSALQKTKQLNKLSKKKANKSKNNNKSNNDDWKIKEIEDVDLALLFGNSPKDKHLITEEEYPLPIDPLHELNFDDVEKLTNNFETNFSVRVGPAGISEELCDLNAGTSNETPKRKSRKSFEETPSKRRREDTSSAPSLSKAADATSTSGQVSGSGGRSPIPLHPDRAKKSLTFPRLDNAQESTAVFAEELIEEGPPEDLAVPLPNDSNVADVPEEPMDLQINAFPQTVVPEERPTDHTVVDNVQNTGIDNIQEPASTLQKNQEDDAEKTFSLPELDDSLIHQKRRKRNRRLIFSDEEKKIDIRKNLENPNNPYIHIADPLRNVREKKFAKVPAKTLLSLPSVRLHSRPYRNGIDCCWGKTLTSLFLKMTEKPCTSSEDETGHGELVRNRGTLNKGGRSTTFIVPERPSASHTSELAKSVHQSRSDIYINADDEPGYQNSMLMTPPLQPSFENEQPQTTPEREREAQPSSIVQQKRSRTASAVLKDHLISTAAISPRQRGRSSGAGLPQHEPQHASESPSAAPLITDVARSERSLSSTPDNFSTNDSESARLERLKYFMSKDEFEHFLEKIWNGLRNKSSYKNEELKCNLTDILVPGESSREEVIVYFNYLFGFEKQGKLLIKQDIPYGPVTIVKID